MDWIKIILAALGLFFAIAIIFWLIGIVSALLWYVFWIAVLGAIGYGGYKLFLDKEKETARLEEKTPVGISEMKNVDRELEEYKRKYLPK
ncbi:MAG TPA: hypothetical protein VGC76_12770 [Pyrinomonadaceae bacterium]|jgi:hypothetical protein